MGKVSMVVLAVACLGMPARASEPASPSSGDRSALGKLPAQGTNPQAATAGYATQVRPFLDAHCTDCHGASAAKVGLRLDSFAPDFAAADAQRMWAKVLERLEAGDVTPRIVC